MPYDFNVLNNVAPIPATDMETITIAGLCERFNYTVKQHGFEFEENEFAVLLPASPTDRIYEVGKFNPRILCAARAGHNEGYYIYVYVSTPTSMKPILSAKVWQWQTMVAIQGVVTAMLRNN